MIAFLKLLKQRYRDQANLPKTDRTITTRGLQPLTAKLLSTTIARNLTLGDFLTRQCSPLTSGKCKMYATSQTKHFGLLLENRPVNEIHLQSLMESFSKDGYSFTLIYVVSGLYILELRDNSGQRFTTKMVVEK